MTDADIDLRLESLYERVECLTQAAALNMAESCVVMMDAQGHGSGVAMDVRHNSDAVDISLSWQIQLSDRMKRGNRDHNKTLDNAACAVALLLVSELTDFHGYEQSATGDRIDYYLRSNPRDDTLIFNDTRKLEISGIARENSGNTLKSRVREKRKRFNELGGPGTGTETAYICVVEFSHPKSELVLT